MSLHQFCILLAVSYWPNPLLQDADSIRVRTKTIQMELATQDNAAPPKYTVKRATRPTFSKRLWDGIFFENLFADGLKGERPPMVGIARRTQPSTTLDKPMENGNTQLTWSGTISAEAIETEIKRLNNLLNTQITNPTTFSSKYRETQVTFSTLSVLFAVIHEFDKSVRWKDHALNAQAACYRAATFPSNRMREAFEFAKTRNELLSELIRGSGFPPEETAGEELDWESVAERTPLMKRLDDSLYKKLSAWVANETEFKNQKDELIQEAQMIAVIGRSMVQEGMIDADDDEYVVLSEAMFSAAVSAVSAAKSNNYELASQAVNTLGQSCNKCHEVYR
ncbi:MAG TPA: hypothetical protein PKD64_00045 [Pirellulaceae bacterium]|nr:hypothetical protein [Pirellulaceae bacterium]HMO90561.1 hypothetical protein [Pirellulaceae bacterium]HMP71220.1 hypothetical protein [Pirellulaceae bacterium]